MMNRLFFESVPAALAMFDRQMCYLCASRRWREDFQLGDRELVGVSHYEVFPEIPEHWRQAHQQALSGETVRADAEKFVRADGRVQWLRWEIQPWHEERGEIGGIVIFCEEITRQKETEAVLRRYELLARHSRDVILFLRYEDGQILEANDAAVQLYGYSHEEFLALTIHDLRAPESHSLTAEQMTAADQRGILFETLHRRKGGTPFPVEVSSRGMIVDGVHSLISIVRDISERRRAEEALHENEARLRQHIDNTPMAVIEWDERFVITRWAGGAEKIFGWSADEMVGRAIGELQIVYPADLPLVEATVQRLTDGKTSQYVASNRNLTRYGEVRHCSWHNSVLFDSEGRMRSVLSLVEDITERVKAVERLDLLAASAGDLLRSDAPAQLLDRLCRRVLDCLDSQIFFCFLVDEKSGVLRLNACAGIAEADQIKSLRLDDDSSITALTARTASRTIEERVHESIGTRGAMIRAIGLHAYACYPLTAGGKVFGTLSFGSQTRDSFSDDDQALMQAVADQVAIALLRQRGEEELRRARAAAEAATVAKSQFLANMSHELRTPMTGVLGMLELAQENPADEKQRIYLETARSSAQALMRILNDILDLSKIESGRMSLVSEPFILAETVEKVRALFEYEAAKKGLNLRVRLGNGLPGVVVGDEERLRQVLVNLVSNAVKFTEKGEVQIGVEKGLPAESGREAVVFQVSDTGIGIPPDRQHLLFRHFSQIDSTNTRRYGGTGLGLAISRELVEMMEGSISVVSRPEGGSIFSVTVPLKPVTGVQTGAISGSGPSVGGLPAGRLLVAEDDVTTQQMLDAFLHRAGFSLDIVANGKAATEAARLTDYDLILLDVQMPERDGYEAARLIRADEQQRGKEPVPIIAMTAHAFREDVERCHAAGMDAFIAKPFELKGCLELIRSLLPAAPARR